MTDMPAFTSDEMMAVAAARTLPDRAVCFVGIGLPSTAANLARATHAPGTVLIYESGTMGAKPTVLPLSIGDGELATTADDVIPTHEVFRYWLQGGRVDVGFLGAAQIDRFANINTTVIGPYEEPKVRLPGAGGAPEIAAHAKEVILILKHSRRAFVQQLDFVTTIGFLHGGDSRGSHAVTGSGPQTVITDLGILRPDAETKELVLTEIHPGVELDRIKAETGWPLKVRSDLRTTKAPTDAELAALRDLKMRTANAHGPKEQ